MASSVLPPFSSKVTVVTSPPSPTDDLAESFLRFIATLPHVLSCEHLDGSYLTDGSVEFAMIDRLAGRLLMLQGDRSRCAPVAGDWARSVCW
jgi:hypothetical protein